MNRENVAWRGAILFESFPINVALYSRVKKQRNDSFKMIAPSGQPAKQPDHLIDSADGTEFPKDQVRKGVETAKDQYAVLTTEAIDQINAGVKTSVAQPDLFVPVADLGLDLAIDRYAVRPDSKVPGSDQATNILWNGLVANGLALVTQVSLTGGHDGLLVVYGDPEGLWAAMLPFAEELYRIPEFEFVVDDKAANLFGTVIGQTSLAGEWEHAAYRSEYRARREQAIASVIGDEEPFDLGSDDDYVHPAVPDLLAVLQAKIEETKTKEKVTA